MTARDELWEAILDWVRADDPHELRGEFSDDVAALIMKLTLEVKTQARNEQRAKTEREIVQLVTDRLKNWKFADVNQELKSLRNYIASGRYRKGDE